MSRQGLDSDEQGTSSGQKMGEDRQMGGLILPDGGPPSPWEKKKKEKTLAYSVKCKNIL